MIDNDKIGKYIKDLRNKNKLTQEELADKIHVSRQAVSNWETGKDAPSVDSVKDICLIFNVSIADIYAGEKVNDIKTLNDVIHGLVSMEMKKSKKILFFSSLIIFFLIVLFLVYYFITYYNNITAYLIKGDTPNYDINGIMNKSVDNLYFNLEIDTKPDKMCLVYKEENLVCETNNNYITFTESNGYNEVIPLDNNKYNDYISNMYISIENDGKREDFKLDIRQVYRNSNLIKENNNNIISNDDNYSERFPGVPEKVRKYLKYDEKNRNFYKKDNNVLITYYVDSEVLNVVEDEGNITKRWNYNTNDKMIVSYYVIDSSDSKTINSYNNIRENDNDKNKKEIFKYFKDNYIDKYLE